MEIFINGLVEVAPDKFSIGAIHFQPLDSVNGLGKSLEELTKEGVIISNYTEPEIQEGFTSTMYYSSTKGIFYEYAPTLPEELIIEELIVEELPTQEEIIAEATKPLEDKLSQTEKENEALKMLLKMKGIDI